MGEIFKLIGDLGFPIAVALAGETVDPRAWKPEKNKDRKYIKSKLGYSRVGLGNV